MKKRVGALILAIAVLTGAFTGCAQKEAAVEQSKSAAIETADTEATATDTAATDTTTPEASAATAEIPAALKDKALKIMVVRKIGGDDHTAQFLAGTQEEG